MTICCVVGARPNYMKMAPVVEALSLRGVRPLLVHTGQHYDPLLNDVFFNELQMPAPDVNLGIGSGTHARQTAQVMTAFEEVCLDHSPDLVMVAGDVNSTLAAALVAAKLNIPSAHIEAGLRSFDRTMPEEINRILTDQLSDYLFTSEESGNDHLRQEGICSDKIHYVGNCMVDSLRKFITIARDNRPWESLGLVPHQYGLVTLHRPANVDNPQAIQRVASILNEIAERIPLVFPVHPRTKSKLASVSLSSRIQQSAPLSYLQFLGVMSQARLVLTDSGGIQEETSALGIPCLTMRETTERPATVTLGTNRIVGMDLQKIHHAVTEIVAGRWSKGIEIPLWDGQAAVRLVEVTLRGLDSYRFAMFRKPA